MVKTLHIWEKAWTLFFALLFVCCAALPAATAEWEITAEKTDTYKMENYCFTGFLKISSALISREGKGYALRDADGNILSETYDRTGIANNEFPVLYVCQDGSWGAVNGQGMELVPCRYLDIDVISEKWAVGMLGRKAEDGEAYDYSDKMRITQVDVWYQGTLVTSLEREEYDYGYAYGDYVIMKRREEKGGFRYIGISAAGEKRDAESYKQYSGSYGNIIHNASGRKAFAPDCSLRKESLSPALWHVGGGVFSDVCGNTFMIPAATGITDDCLIDGNNGYIIVRDEHKKEGVCTMEGEEVLPCAYDDIGGFAGVMFAKGYQAVVKDGRVGYVDVSGNETSGFQIARTDNLNGYLYNCPFMWASDLLTGKTLIVSAEKGILPREYDDVIRTRSPYAFVLGVKDNGLCGAVDLYGNEIIPLKYKEVSVSYDGTFAVCRQVKDRSTYDIYRITCTETGLSGETGGLEQPENVELPENEKQHEAPEDGDGVRAWTYPNCGKEGNTGNFCPGCAAPRP